MLGEQRGPRPEEDELLLLLLGVRALAARLRGCLERAGRDGNRAPPLRGGADAPLPPELAAWLGVLALGDRVEAWLDGAEPLPPATPVEAPPPPPGRLELLR